jgi:hypothetical protein
MLALQRIEKVSSGICFPPAHHEPRQRSDLSAGPGFTNEKPHGYVSSHVDAN